MKARVTLSLDILHIIVWIIILVLGFRGVFPWWAIGLVALNEIHGIVAKIPLNYQKGN